MEQLLELLKTLQKDVHETRDRAKRLETRVTKYLEIQGFDTQVRRCQWDDEIGGVHIPSQDVTLREIVRLIPDMENGRIPIMVKGDTIGWFYKP